MRLHPLSILFQILAGRGLRVLNSVITIGAFLTLPFLGGSSSIFSSGIIYIVIIFGTVFVVYFVWELLYYYFFKYDLTEHQFELTSGVFFRRNRELPFHRIQNVDIHRSLFQRVLGLSEIRLESAGGSQTEIVLQCVGKTEGERIRNRIRREKERIKETGTEKEEGEQTEPVLLFELSWEEYILLALTAAEPRIFLSMVGFLPLLVFLGIFQFTSLQLILLLVLGFFMLIGTWGLAGVSRLTTYYGFRLLERDQSLEYERGLLHRRNGTIPADKIQKLVIRENVLMRMFGFAALDVETAGYAHEEALQRESIVPLARKKRLLSIAHRIKPFQTISPNHPPKRTRLRYGLQYAFLLLFISAGCLLGTWLYRDQLTGLLIVPYLWLVPLIFLPGVPLAAHLTWVHLGYQLMDRYAVFREGFWNRRTMILSYDRLQTAITSRSLFQRFWNLSTFTFDTAGSHGIYRTNPSAINIDRDRAVEIENAVRQKFRTWIKEQRQKRASSDSDDLSVSF